MKKIAITGVIASGKSEACKIIESLGGYVIYTDKINSELLENNEYQNKLSKIFPNAIQNGVVNKSVIRSEILNNNSKRLALNDLSHKEIKQKVEFLINNFNGKTIFCEIPLIVESGMASIFDEIWCVVADRQTKINRIIMRDKVSRVDAEKIIDCQKSDDELIRMSDVIIDNSSDYDSLKKQIEEIYSNRVI